MFVPLRLPDVTLPVRESMRMLSEEYREALGLFGLNLLSSEVCGQNPISSGGLKSGASWTHKILASWT